jgi:FkbM family methyltransferase
LWSRWGTTDVAVRAENIIEYPSLLAALAPWDIRTVVDAGSNSGYSTWQFATAFPNASVVALEAGLRSFAITRLNTQASPNVLALRAALWGRTEQVALRDNGHGEWAMSAVATSDSVDHRPPTSRETLPGVSLPFVMRSLCWEGVDFLKLDIEGGESSVLSPPPAGVSAAEAPHQWLSRIRFLYAELHPQFSRAALRHSLGALLASGMNVLTNPNLRHPAVPNAHEWVFLACGSGITYAHCLAVCLAWRAGTDLRCTHVTSADDYWGAGHIHSDCDLAPLGLDAAERQRCHATAANSTGAIATSSHAKRKDAFGGAFVEAAKRIETFKWKHRGGSSGDGASAHSRRSTGAGATDGRACVLPSHLLASALQWRYTHGPSPTHDGARRGVMLHVLEQLIEVRTISGWSAWRDAVRARHRRPAPERARTAA